MKKWSVLALLLVGASVLGATVLREPVAWAAQTVGATIIGPLDGNGNVKVQDQGVTKLLFRQVVQVSDPPVTVDVAEFRTVRMYIQTGGAGNCPAFVELLAQEGATFIGIEAIVPNCGSNDTRLLEVPGRTLNVRVLGSGNEAAIITIFGRYN